MTADTERAEQADSHDEAVYPSTAQKLATRLAALRNARRQRQASRRATPTPRRKLTQRERAAVLAKTGGRCHICGGMVRGREWEADHVLAHGAGGTHSVEDYLPAHTLCNGYRWDYSSEEFQWVLKIGVWARKVMEDGSPLGADILARFFAHEVRREKRRRAALAR